MTSQITSHQLLGDSDMPLCVSVLLLGCKVVLHLVLYGNRKLNSPVGGQYNGSMSQYIGDTILVH
jgi:hypothetical protein